MERKRKPFGRRKPHSIRYMSTSEEFHRGELEKRVTRTLDISKVRINLILLLVLSVVVISFPETRAFATEKIGWVFEISKSWILKGTLNIK